VAGSRRSNFTRRQFLGGGAIVASAGVLAGYGHFALGDEFEEHVAGVLGISTPLAKRLLEVSRQRLPDVDYRARAAAFTIATTLPVSLLGIHPLRERAVGGFVRTLIDSSTDNLRYLGLQKNLDSEACDGLVRA
jgi:hypothetical protein